MYDSGSLSLLCSYSKLVVIARLAEVVEVHVDAASAFAAFGRRAVLGEEAAHLAVAQLLELLLELRLAGIASAPRPGVGSARSSGI